MGHIAHVPLSANEEYYLNVQSASSSFELFLTSARTGWRGTRQWQAPPSKTSEGWSRCFAQAPSSIADTADWRPDRCLDTARSFVDYKSRAFASFAQIPPSLLSSQEVIVTANRQPYNNKSKVRQTHQ